MAVDPFFADRVAFNTASTGTGNVAASTVLGASFLLPSDTAIATGDRPYIMFQQGDDFEISKCTQVSTGPSTFSRDTCKVSKIAGTVGTTKLTLGGSAVCRFVDPAEVQKFAAMSPDGHGDSNHTITNTMGLVYTTAAFTAVRTWALPTAASYPPNVPLTISDLFGGVSGAFPLIIDGNASELIDGALTYTIGSPYGSVTLVSNTLAWKVASAVKASGSDLLIPATAFSGQSFIDFDLAPYSGRGYTEFLIRFWSVTNGSDADFVLRTSPTNAGSLASAGTDYDTVMDYALASAADGVWGGAATLTDSGIVICFMGNSANDIIHNSEIRIFNPFVAHFVGVQARTVLRSDSEVQNHLAVGSRLSSAVVNYVRVLPTAGTITGNYSFHGVR